MTAVEDPYQARLMAAVLAAMEVPPGDPDLAAWFAACSVRPGDYEPPDVEVATAAVPGPHGDIPVRVYGGASTDPVPMLVWCHGGGWVGGDLDMPEADTTARAVAARSGAVVVSVDYRLAIDGVHYPVPLDDVVAAFTWAVNQAESFGADPLRVSLGGASAGANLSAGAALRLRDQGGPRPHTSVLVYPLVHPTLPPMSDELAAKVARLSPLLGFAPEVLTPTVENYLGGPVDGAPVYAMPGLGDLTGLPPTLIINCEYDALRASGEAYASALGEARVDVAVSCAPGVAHGHLNQPWLDAADESLGLIVDWMTAR